MPAGSWVTATRSPPCTRIRADHLCFGGKPLHPKHRWRMRPGRDVRVLCRHDLTFHSSTQRHWLHLLFKVGRGLAFTLLCRGRSLRADPPPQHKVPALDAQRVRRKARSYRLYSFPSLDSFGQSYPKPSQPHRGLHSEFHELTFIRIHFMGLLNVPCSQRRRCPHPVFLRGQRAGSNSFADSPEIHLPAYRQQPGDRHRPMGPVRGRSASPDPTSGRNHG